MAIRNIVTEGEAVLGKKCREVTEFNERLAQLLDDMLDTLKHTETGVGLAAPQVGMCKRALVISYDEKDYEMVNPEITAKRGKVEGTEGCLSCPEQYGIVPRAEAVTVEYQDRFGARKRLKADGYLARIIQHEADHLDGILFKDRATRMLSPEEMANG